MLKDRDIRLRIKGQSSPRPIRLRGKFANFVAKQITAEFNCLTSLDGLTFTNTLRVFVLVIIVLLFGTGRSMEIVVIDFAIIVFSCF